MALYKFSYTCKDWQFTLAVKTLILNTGLFCMEWLVMARPLFPELGLSSEGDGFSLKRSLDRMK